MSLICAVRTRFRIRPSHLLRQSLPRMLQAPRSSFLPLTRRSIKLLSVASSRGIPPTEKSLALLASPRKQRSNKIQENTRRFVARVFLYFVSLVLSARIELASAPSEGAILSVERRELNSSIYTQGHFRSVCNSMQSR